MPRPNIVFILSDDQGAWGMGCAGNREILTPNMDRIAREGLRFDNFFCASPVCSPARASLLTGRMPSRHGILDWLRAGNLDKQRFAAQGLENPHGGYADETEPIAYLDGQPTYVSMLKSIGYTCALSGKWHMGDSVHPQQGFSDWYTIGQGGCWYYHPDIVENGNITVRHGEYVTELITRRAVEDIEKLAGRSEPFYLSVHYTAPHSPWGKEHHPKKWIDHYDTCPFESVPDVPDHPDMTTGPVYGTSRRRENLRGYFAAISAMDEGVGEILGALEHAGILDETLVIFAGDNGMCMGHHGIWGKGNGTFPMNMYDPSVKVPFMLRWPRMVKQPGRVVTDLVSACDLYPTLCELTGEKAPDGLPGHSFLNALSGGKTGRGQVVIYDEYGPVRMIRTEDWKLIRRYPYGPNELYDLQNDPGEENNLFGLKEHEVRVMEMTRELERFFISNSDPALDGVRQGVTGSGQLCRPGVYATRPEVFKPRPVTRREQPPLKK